MKKLLLVLCACLLCSCSNTDNTASKTCSITQDPLTVEIALSAKDDTINTMNFAVTMDASQLGLGEELGNITDEQKDTIKDNLLQSLGIDENTTGITVDAKFDDNINMEINIDLEACSEETLKTFNFEEDDLSLENAVEQFVAQGYTCK